MVKQKSNPVLSHGTGAVEHATNISLDQVRIEPANPVEAELSKYLGTMAQLPNPCRR